MPWSKLILEGRVCQYSGCVKLKCVIIFACKTPKFVNLKIFIVV